MIIDNFESHHAVVNNHGSMIKIDGQWYIFYHRPTQGGSSMRKACVEPIFFRSDGTIKEVEMTTQGAGGPISPLRRMEAARACRLSGNLTIFVLSPHYDIPVEYLSSIRDGDCAYWKYYDFSKAKVNRFICKTWDKNLSGQIEIRLDTPDGELIGTCVVAPMKGEVAYGIHEAKIKPVKGKHALVFVFKATNPNDKKKELMNLEWFVFENRK